MRMMARRFRAVMEKLEELPVEMVAADTMYKTPAIAKLFHDKGIRLLSTYKRPQTKKGFFPKHEYVYDECNDRYLCPQDQVLSHYTTDREGYREYRINLQICVNCP